MKNSIKIESRGTLPKILAEYCEEYNGKEATKDIVQKLDSDITFVVCDLRLAHGNLNKRDRSAWLCPANNDDSFNVRISW